jgi:hypothetical protein
MPDVISTGLSPVGSEYLRHFEELEAARELCQAPRKLIPSRH